jgi:hypothetical protein
VQAEVEAEADPRPVRAKDEEEDAISDEEGDEESQLDGGKPHTKPTITEIIFSKIDEIPKKEVRVEMQVKSAHRFFDMGIFVPVSFPAGVHEVQDRSEIARGRIYNYKYGDGETAEIPAFRDPEI